MEQQLSESEREELERERRRRATEAARLPWWLRWAVDGTLGNVARKVGGSGP